MTQLHLIEQAKQGDPSAIAALMNKSLQPKGMTATVNRYADRLEVTLEAERVPNRQALTAFVEKGISNLGLQMIQSVKVSGQQIGAESPAWSHELYLETPTPEFEPDASAEQITSSVEMHTAELGAEPVGTVSSQEFDQDFNMDDVTESQQDEQQFDDRFDEPQFNELTDLTDLSQLQDLLSEEPEQPVSDRQRQLLEEQIESIWQEQTAQTDNFLADLISSTPEEPNVQLEEFLDSSPDVQFEGQSEGLWLEQNPEPVDEFDFFTEQNSSSDSADDGDFNLFAEASEPIETVPSWMDTSGGEEEEPDEILTGFMDDQFRSPSSEFDLAAGDEEDEPDEILTDFLPRQSDQVDEPGLELDELAGLPSEEELVNFFEESSEPLEQPTSAAAGSEAPISEESIDFLVDASEDSEGWAVDTDEQRMADSPVEANAFEIGAFDADEFSSVNEFGANEFRNQPSELSFDDVSLTFDDSPSDDPGMLTDSPTESWDQPPIEFLQDEPDLSLPEMPTEQLDEPLAAFMTEQSIDSSFPLEPAMGDFPQDFLQDSQEPLENLSEEFYVDPNENPFIEQMEENRDRPDEFPSDTPQPMDEEFEAFDQTDWQLPSSGPSYSDSGEPNDLSGLPSDLSGLTLESLQPSDPLDFSLEQPDQSEDYYSTYSSNSSSDLVSNDLASDDLSEESLIDFFATDPQPSSDAIDSSDAVSQLSEADLQPSDQYGQYREYGLSDEYGLGEPAASSNSIPTQPPVFPGTESVFPDTEIGEPQLPDTQIPVREELSQEALEAQLETSEFGQIPATDDRQDSSVIIPPDAEVEPQTESRGSPWLFPLIFLGISGWIVGLISFAFLWSRLSSPPPIQGQDPSQPTDVAGAPLPADACTPPAEGGAPVALSNLQFQPNTENPQQVNLVGCVTNQTQQAIDIVSVAYRSGAGGSTVGGLNIPDNLIQPGQTVAFTSRFTVPSDVSNVAIDSVFWQPAGTTASEEAGTSIQVNR